MISQGCFAKIAQGVSDQPLPSPCDHVKKETIYKNNWALHAHVFLPKFEHHKALGWNSKR